MNLKRQLLLLAIIVAATFSLTNTTCGQNAVIPVHATPCAEPQVQQVFDGAIQSLTGTQPSYYQRVGFTQYMEERYPLDLVSDYTPELIGTYEPLTGSKARQIGLATMTEYSLGHGKHSPLNFQGIAQTGYFEPVAEVQVAQLPSDQFQIGPSPSFFNETGVPIRQDVSLDEAPRLFRDQISVVAARSSLLFGTDTGLEWL